MFYKKLSVFLTNEGLDFFSIENQCYKSIGIITYGKADKLLHGIR